MSDHSHKRSKCVTAEAEPTLRSLADIRPLYVLPVEPLIEEVLIPGFKIANRVDCMVGYFSSKVLASLAPGLATYIADSENSFRLIISPLVTAEDQVAIEAGLKQPEEVADHILEDLTMTADVLQQYTLKCLSWLLRERRMEIRVALMEAALFHPKVWLFDNGADCIAVHGSSNVTESGIKRNIEQVAVSASWLDPTQSYITSKLRRQFDRLWDNREDHCRVIPLSKAVTERLLRTYSSTTRPTEEELVSLYKRILEEENISNPVDLAPSQPVGFSIPSSLKYEEGPFAHQGKAVTAWCRAGYRGVLEMATGSGKTITSMICAHRLYEQHKPLLVVVAAPYIPLIEQWCDEITPFGLKPVNLTAVGGLAKRTGILRDLRRRIGLGLSDVEAMVVSHDTLCTREFRQAIETFDCTKLLIADEAHNLGRPSFINEPPECFQYRLGLSATPERQYDDEGTAALFKFFGPVVFRFTLEEAIGRCLVEYDYYVHPVYLTATEMDDWLELTAKIKQNAWRSEGGKPDVYLAKLLRDRRALLETASGKIQVLASLLDAEALLTLKHTLIYASDKGPDQLLNVNRLLQNRSVLFHQLTAEETANRTEAMRIIKSFQDGEIQVLTAKRVLDEGVNIPQICKAFILASTTVERQWVQRRGRLLRICKAIGKTHSVVHDLLALPPNMQGDLDRDARALVRSELQRAQEFARLARNAGRPDGPLATIGKMVDAAYL